jgi:hypothetical protein
MKKTFPGYYRPTTDEFKELWGSAQFAFDANVLLNIYGYSSRTQKTLLGVIESIQARLWMPYQFALEYQRNRIKAILEQVDNYRSVRKGLKKILDENLKPPHRHPFISKSSMAHVARICRELENGERQHESLLSDDPTFAKVSALLDGRIGPPPQPEQLPVLHQAARDRYARSIPPGYADSSKKPEPQSFADYIGWQQILDHGTSDSCALILITDDRKDDWWYIQQERHIGPRPELIAEYALACQRPFYMYSLEQFMSRAQENLGRRVEPAALQEVRQRSEAQSETESPKPVQMQVSAPTAKAVPKHIVIDTDELEAKTEAADVATTVLPSRLVIG